MTHGTEENSSPDDSLEVKTERTWNGSDAKQLFKHTLSPSTCLLQPIPTSNHLLTL